MSTNLGTILKELESKLNGHTVVLGIGNILRGDDAFGSLLAQRIKDKVSLKVWDGASSPENFLGKIVDEKPATVLLVDAIDFSEKPGAVRLFTKETLKTGNFFLTHNPSPRLIFDFLRASTMAKTYILAVQPKSIGLGNEMSTEVEQRLEELTRWFKTRYSNHVC